MFVVCKTHLKSVLTTVGFTVIHEFRGPQVATREARVFSFPERGVLANNFNFRRKVVERYKDPTDLETVFGLPKIKERVIAANQNITFAVELTNKTAVDVNNDFKNFIRNLGDFIGDGQTATRVGEDGSTRVDTKGNNIAIVLGAYDFNDNKLYGEHPHMVLIEVEFQGAIYQVPDTEPGPIQVPAAKVNVRPGTATT